MDLFNFKIIYIYINIYFINIQVNKNKDFIPVPFISFSRITSNFSMKNLFLALQKGNLWKRY